MKCDVIQEAENYTKKRRQRKRWHQVVALLACVVMLCTLYALVLPAITMGQDTCDLPEHTHSETCYDEDGTLICGLDEHTHSDACRSDNSDASEHTHDETCYDDNGMLICDLQESQNDQPEPTEESVHTSDEPSNDENETQSADSNETQSADSNETQPVDSNETQPADLNEPQDNQTDDSANHAIQPVDEGDSGTGEDVDKQLTVTLMYNVNTQEKTHEDLPDGVEEFTSRDMSGFISFDPHGMTEDLTDVTVELVIPKKYVDRNRITLTDFHTNSQNTKWQKIPLREDEENFYIGFYFDVYDRTEAVSIPFAVHFLEHRAPRTPDYKLLVSARVQYGQTEYYAEPNIYKPKYIDYTITKFLSSNDYWRFSGQEQSKPELFVVPVQTEDGRYCLGADTDVPFKFRINAQGYYGGVADTYFNRRDLDTITLTDTLPVYQDINGETRTAVFAPEKNEGWTLNAERTAVSKTYNGTDSCDLLNQIKADEPLLLQFPGLPLERNEGGYLAATMKNEVAMEGIPSNKVDGEQNETASNTLTFHFTTDDSMVGNFVKGPSRLDIQDTYKDKTTPFQWRIYLNNTEKNRPLEHITIQDRKNVQDGEWGCDERLKFVKLESFIGDKKPGDKKYSEIIDKVVAYYTDGTTQDFLISAANEIDAAGNIRVLFNEEGYEDKICDGYEIIFKDDYKLNLGNEVGFFAYTVYRDPSGTHADPNEMAPINWYHNIARVVCHDENENYTYLYHEKRDYRLKPVSENLSISKLTFYNGGDQNNQPGQSFAYSIWTSGSLLEAEDKEYKNLRLIDLLPNGISYSYLSLSGPLFPDGFQPEIVENYHNSGRTAVIFPIDAEKLREYWLGNIYAPITFFVEIDQDATPGTVTNHIYLVGDDLDEPNNGVIDIYDLNDNGSTDDKVIHSESNAIITGAQAVSAVKFVAQEGSNGLTKQGLNILAGSNFDYVLRINNTRPSTQEKVEVYDVLPQIGDTNILTGTNARNSEFGVHLRGPIQPPENYSVLYTESQDVYGMTMSEAIARVNWTATPSDYANVTAFYLIQNGGAVLEGNSSVDFRIPVYADAELSQQSMEMLHAKEESYLQANNSFGFRTFQFPEDKLSNSVWVRIPFAEFTLKKVDDRTNGALSGAEFTLTDEDGAEISTKISNENGIVRFKDLIVGTYTLTETRAPAGYYEPHVSLKVTITQNPLTMEHHVAFEGDYPGAGTADDPLVIGNHASYELPTTGGIGTAWHKMAGLLLILAALSGALYCRIKRKTADCTNC